MSPTTDMGTSHALPLSARRLGIVVTPGSKAAGQPYPHRKWRSSHEAVLFLSEVNNATPNVPSCMQGIREEHSLEDARKRPPSGIERLIAARRHLPGVLSRTTGVRRRNGAVFFAVRTRITHTITYHDATKWWRNMQTCETKRL